MSAANRPDTAAETDADLVVAGAGAAGTAAALAAAGRGRQVVLIEANEHFRRGSNTAMSTSMVPAGGSRWQAAAGIEDSPRRFLADIMAKTKGAADERLARALTDVAPELVEWLADTCGVPLELVTDFSYPGHSANRCHAVADRAGSTLHRHLLDAVAAAEGITLVVPMELASVVLSPGGGVVARVRTPDGQDDEIRANALVLATNGFGADPRLVAELVPRIADGVYHGGDNSTGDALRIGRELDLDTGFLDAFQGHGSLAVPHRILLTWAFVMHGGVLLNTEGRRFGDETLGYSEFGPIVVDQPGSIAWAVYDERIHRTLLAFRDYRDLLDIDGVHWCEDLDEVAMATGIAAERIHDEMTLVDRAARGVAEDAHGRERWEAPLAPPFAVVRVTGALFHTQGGLRVDDRARAQRDGQPVPGLYAAGGAAMGISGHGADGYLAGNGLLSALGLGYLAGNDVGATT